MAVSYAELIKKVWPYGAIGKYLVENVINFNNASEQRSAEYRVLGDSPAIGLIMYEDCGQWSYEQAPEFDDEMQYIHNGIHRPIRVYKIIDKGFIMEDFYAKITQFNEKSGS